MTAMISDSCLFSRFVVREQGVNYIIARRIYVSAHGFGRPIILISQQGVDYLADDQNAGRSPSSAFVVAYHRGRDSKMVGELSLGDAEIPPPLLQGLAGILR